MDEIIRLENIMEQSVETAFLYIYAFLGIEYTWLHDQ